MCANVSAFRELQSISLSERHIRSLFRHKSRGPGWMCANVSACRGLNCQTNLVAHRGSGIVRLNEAVFSVYKVPGDGQKQWVLTNVLEALYPGQKTTKRKEKWNLVVNEVQAVHRRLWPNVEVLLPKRLEIEGAAELEVCMATSFFFATLIWGWTAAKRSPDSKLVCASLFSDAVRVACNCADGVPLQFLVVHTDGRKEMRRPVVGPSMLVDCWTPSMSAAVSYHWDTDYWNEDLQIPSSSRARTTLSDYILWCLQPVPINVNSGSLRMCKQQLTPSAQQMVTHLALHFDAAVLPDLFMQADDPNADAAFQLFQTAGSKRRRLASSSMNVVAASAAQKLHLGEEQTHIITSENVLVVEPCRSDGPRKPSRLSAELLHYGSRSSRSRCACPDFRRIYYHPIP